MSVDIPSDTIPHKQKISCGKMFLQFFLHCIDAMPVWSAKMLITQNHKWLQRIPLDLFTHAGMFFRFGFIFKESLVESKHQVQFFFLWKLSPAKSDLGFSEFDIVLIIFFHSNAFPILWVETCSIYSIWIFARSRTNRYTFKVLS